VGRGAGAGGAAGFAVAGAGAASPQTRNVQRAAFKASDLESLTAKNRGPMSATLGVVLELPHMDELVDRAGVALEVADQVLGMAALFEGRKAEFLIEADRLGHLADVERIGP